MDGVGVRFADRDVGNRHIRRSNRDDLGRLVVAVEHDIVTVAARRSKGDTGCGNPKVHTVEIIGTTRKRIVSPVLVDATMLVRLPTSEGETSMMLDPAGGSARGSQPEDVEPPAPLLPPVLPLLPPVLHCCRPCFHCCRPCCRCCHPCCRCYHQCFRCYRRCFHCCRRCSRCCHRFLPQRQFPRFRSNCLHPHRRHSQPTEPERWLHRAIRNACQTSSGPFQHACSTSRMFKDVR